MKPRAPLLAVATLGLAVLLGCGVGDLIKKGDQQMLAGRPDLAVQSYEKAISKKPDIVEKQPDLLDRLNQARTQAAYNEGLNLVSRKQYEQAIGSFDRALQLAPTFSPASEARDAARRSAAEVRHRKAVQLADGGQLTEAAAELRRAVELDPANASARAALDSLSGRPAAGDAAVLYTQALELVAQKNWSAAADRLASVTSIDPDFLPARAEMVRVRQNLDAAQQARFEGQRMLSQRRLDEAITALQKALSINPYDADAKRFLADATTQRTAAQSHFDRANQLFREGQFDEAVRAAQAALLVYPSFRAADDLANRARSAALEARIAEGRRLLAAANFNGAEAAFNRALQYDPASDAARRGLAQVADGRANAFERAGRPGAALLWAIAASERHTSPEFSDHARTLKAILLGRASVDLLLDPGDAFASADARRFHDQLAAALAAPHAPFIRVVARPDPQRQPFVAVAGLTGIDVRQQLAARENRAYDYTIAQTIPNPEIPELRAALHAARVELARMEALVNAPCPDCRGGGRLVCATCAGTGLEPCPTCRGRGIVTCSLCHGTGKIGGNACPYCGGPGTHRCPTCLGQGQRKCTVCHGHNSNIVCPRCHGNGRLGDVSPGDIRRQANEVRRIERALATASPTAIVQTSAQWPYTVDTFEKVGRLDARVQLTPPGAEGPVYTDNVEAEARAADQTIAGANPGIGLGDDPLQLPPDEAIRAELIAAAAKETAAKLFDATTRVSADGIRNLADQLDREGRGTEALEARVDAALLIETVDPERGSADLQALRRQAPAAP